MSPRYLLHLFRIGLLLLIVVTPAIAQDDTLDELYIDDAETFQIQVPSDWDVSSSLEAFTIFSGNSGNGTIEVVAFSPTALTSFGIKGDTAIEFAKKFGEAMDITIVGTEQFGVRSRDASISAVDLDDQPGIGFAVELDSGAFGMVLFLAERKVLQSDSSLLIAILETYNSIGIILPAALENHDQDWQMAIAELEDLGVFEPGGNLIFEEDQAFFDGIGSWFTPLARQQPFTNVVMAGQLDFTSDSDEIETCGLLARVQTEGSQAEFFLEVGIDNEENIYYVDRFGTNNDEIIGKLFPAEIDFNEPHHLLLIAQEDNLSVYLDGELVFAKEKVTSRSGVYGLGLIGAGRESRCEGTNIWAYSIPLSADAACKVSTTSTVNKRGGPGTNFDRVGTFENGEIMPAIGQTTASDGFLWWELEDGTWVREDIVTTSGNCNDLPDSG